MARMRLSAQGMQSQLCLEGCLSKPPFELSQHDSRAWQHFSHLTLRPEDCQYLDLMREGAGEWIVGNPGTPDNRLIFFLSALECYTLPLPSGNSARIAL
ncbi:MAG: hypothetical protein IT369_18645 [Candidatus Latescibacteria bacterium]|nr:hypothetical protein [Candidatus Latescibacterota bacterium]